MSTIKVYVPKSSVEHVQEGCRCVVLGRYFNVSYCVCLSKQVVVLAVNAAPPNDLWEKGGRSRQRGISRTNNVRKG